MQAASKNQSRPGNSFSSRAPRRSTDFQPCETHLNSGLQDCKGVHMCHFSPLHLWKFVTAALGNEHHLQKQLRTHQQPLSFSVGNAVLGNHFLSLQTCLFWTLHVSGIMRGIAFRVWLLLPSIIFSGFTKASLLLMAEQYSIGCSMFY